MKTVISRRSSASEPSPVVGQSYQAEPSLLPPCKDITPDFADPALQQAYPAFLEKRIQRKPRNLLAHVQRVSLYARRGDAQACYTALIDLFLILGDRGYDLRQRLLATHLALLSEQQRQFLGAHLRSGLKPQHCSGQELEGAYLLQPTSGSLNIIAAMDSPNPGQQADDPGHQQAVLEQSVRTDPGDRQACEALLGFYRSHRMRDAFQSFYAELFSRNMAAPDLWEDTREFLLGNDTSDFNETQRPQ